VKKESSRFVRDCARPAECDPRTNQRATCALFSFPYHSLDLRPRASRVGTHFHSWPTNRL